MKRIIYIIYSTIPELKRGLNKKKPHHFGRMERSSLLHIRTCNFLPRDSSPLWCHSPQREAANGGPASRQHSPPPLPHCAQSSAPVQPLKETACSFLHAGWDKHGFVFISRVCWWHGPGWDGGGWGDVRIYKHRKLTWFHTCDVFTQSWLMLHNVGVNKKGKFCC